MEKERKKRSPIKIICRIVIISIVCVFVLPRIFLLMITLFVPPRLPSSHEEFSTNYTEEEHVARLTQITDYRIEKSWWRTGTEVVEYKIEILYSFYDGDPEYFMITYKTDKGIMYTASIFGDNYFHCPESSSRETTYCEVGVIINDRYRLLPIAGSINNASMQIGNIFELFGYENSKKYYGKNCFGIENENGEIELIYEYGVCEFTGETLEEAPINNVENSYYYHLYNAGENGCNRCFNKRVLTTEEQKPYMDWGYLDISLIKYGDDLLTQL